MNPQWGQVGRTEPWSSRRTRRVAQRGQNRTRCVGGMRNREPTGAPGGAASERARPSPQRSGPFSRPLARGSAALHLPALSQRPLLAPGWCGQVGSGAPSYDSLVASLAPCTRVSKQPAKLVLLHLLQLLAQLVHLLAQLPQLSPQILIVGRRTAATRALAQSHHVAPRPEPHRAGGPLELRFDLAMVAVTDQIERNAALLAPQGGDQIVGVVDRAVVHACDHVARLDSGALGGRAL